MPASPMVVAALRTTVIAAATATVTHPADFIRGALARYIESAACAACWAFLVAFYMASSAGAAGSQGVGSAVSRGLGASHELIRQLTTEHVYREASVRGKKEA